MGTKAHIVIVDGDRAVLADIESRLRELERRWTRFSTGSELSRLNAAAGSIVVVEPDTHRLISCAIDGWTLTGGHYDPTVGAAMKAVGYSTTFDQVVAPCSVTTGPTPGCGAIELYESTSAVFIPTHVELDFGGIAKGFSADLICEDLLDSGRARGICVNIGGDVRIAGEAPTDSGWIVELETTAVNNRAATLVGLSDGAVCTSTTQIRRWDGANGPLHHLLDPSTGAPTESDLVAISVVASTATLAEVLTKSSMILGSQDAATMLTRAGAAAVAVTVDDDLITIGNFAEFVR